MTYRPLRVEIDRATWRCGGKVSFLGGWRPAEGAHGEGCTQLLNPEGFMCCLGFACLVAGLPSPKILTVGEPADADDDEGLLVGTALGNDDFVDAAIRVNDATGPSDADREAQIQDLGRQYQVTFVFTGVYP